MAYTKLFASIIHSTIWQAPPTVKILWVTMLAMVDKNGTVQASIPGLAKASDISIEECISGLEFLKAPDPFSRTKDNEGRRIMEVDGGWFLLNHAKYRAIRSEEDAAEANRLRVQKFREKHKAGPVMPPVMDVMDVMPGNAIQIQIQSTDTDLKDTPVVPKGTDEGTGKKGLQKVDRSSWRDLFAGNPEALKWFSEMLTDREVFLTKRATLGKLAQTPPAFKPTTDAKAFLSRVNAGYSPRLLAVAHSVYLRKDSKVQEGYVQAISTVFGPKKATWEAYVGAAEAHIAEKDAAASIPPPPPPPGPLEPSGAPTIPLDLLAGIPMPAECLS
jgi:hypothetical protein